MENKQKDKWDLTPMYESDEAWYAELEKFLEEIPSLAKYQGKLGESQETLKNFVKESNDMDRRADKLYTYAHLRNDQNTKDPKTQDMNGRGMQMYSKLGQTLAFAEPELLSLDESFIASMLEDPEMQVYHHHFKKLLRKKPHVLSGEMEGLLALASEALGAPQSAFGMLNNADLVFEDAIDSQGKAHKLTHGSYGMYMQSKDRQLRKDAFQKMAAAFKAHINTIASLLASEVKKNVFYARARKYTSAREAALFRNNIPVSVYDKLIDAVNANMPTIYKAFDQRKKQLGVDELHLYDMYVPLSEIEYPVTYDEAKEMTLESVKLYGEEYVGIAKNGFESGWVDVYESEGKRSGAYSSGCYDSAPYMLMNYNGTLNSAFTLTHELGHSMHSYFSRKNQAYVNAGYSIFVAEVASTCNECLLNHYLLNKETDKEKRKYILGHYIDSFRSTIYRQTMFAEFERDIHAHVENGGTLTADFMCEHYIGLVKKYFGPNVVIDEEIKYEWARIPHFYGNFYVYQYATGFSAAVALSDQVISGKPENALRFLSAGGSDYPINVLRNAGIDMESEEPVNRALKVFAEVVEEYNKLI